MPHLIEKCLPLHLLKRSSKGSPPICKALSVEYHGEGAIP